MRLMQVCRRRLCARLLRKSACPTVLKSLVNCRSIRRFLVLVTPVVALVSPGFGLNPNAQEVSDVFEVPLSFLMNPANHRHHQVEWQGVQRHWLSMPYQDGPVERFVWARRPACCATFTDFWRPECRCRYK